jgi:hypothetical protein
MRTFISGPALAVLIAMGGLSAASAQATTSIKCADGSVVTVTTGTKKGTCGKPWSSDGASCVDGGNSASGGCSKGKPICGDSNGAGECTIKSVSTNTPGTKVPRGKTAVPGMKTLKTAPSTSN